MEYLLFIAWLVIFAWLVTKVKFFTQTELSKAQLIIIFLLKIIAGIFYGWIGIYYGTMAQMQDTWSYHLSSIHEYHLLFSDPQQYLSNLFYDPYHSGVDTIFASSQSYWNDLKGNLFIKILSVFDIFSLGHYYINIIFYSFITLFGPLAIYRVMKDVFPGRKTTILLAIILVPSFLYWTSGIHKEGLIFTGIGLVVYAMYFGLKEHRWGGRRILSLLIGLLLLFTLRNFILFIIIPAMIAWLMAAKKPKYGLAIFSSLYLLFIVLFFTVRYISPKLDFPQAVVNKQEAFINIKGGKSTVDTRKLEPTVGSFLRNTPQAINLSMLRPNPSDVHHILSLAAALEMLGLLLLFILFLVYRKPDATSRAIIYFCLFFSFSLLLAIGFSVNNLGAIVRYRSVVIPLLVVPMIAQTDWKRFEQTFSKYISFKNNV
ncbi:MAG: hypothetical protein R2796_08175 [Chitinophagaceae bacterium]|nr:hypothetical protein [Chitinophagaceae bacterium]